MSCVAPQSDSWAHRGSLRVLPCSHTRRPSRSTSAIRMWPSSPDRAEASASAQAAGSRVEVSVCSDAPRHKASSSSVSARVVCDDRGGTVRYVDRPLGSGGSPIGSRCRQGGPARPGIPRQPSTRGRRLDGNDAPRRSRELRTTHFNIRLGITGAAFNSLKPISVLPVWPGREQHVQSSPCERDRGCIRSRFQQPQPGFGTPKDPSNPIRARPHSKWSVCSGRRR